MPIQQHTNSRARSAFHDFVAKLVDEHDSELSRLQCENEALLETVKILQGGIEICGMVPGALPPERRPSNFQGAVKHPRFSEASLNIDVLDIEDDAKEQKEERPATLRGFEAFIDLEKIDDLRRSATLGASEGREAQEPPPEVADKGALAASPSASGDQLLPKGSCSAQLLTGADMDTLLALRKVETEEERLANRYEKDRRRRKFGARGSIMVLGSPESDAWSRQISTKIISSWLFDASIGVVIVANAVTIGIETSHVVANKGIPISIFVLENAFLLVYMIELALRFHAIGHQTLLSNWVKFDAFLVGCGIFDLIIKSLSISLGSSVFDKLMLTRMLRLVRLVRAARLVAQFRTLWILVQGMWLSIIPMLWTFVIMFGQIYIFALFGMELIRTTSEHGEEYEHIARSRFSDLGKAMLTLLQFITLDSVSAIYTPLISARPELCLYFFTFLLLGSVALMNLVTGIMVESSIRQAKEDQEARKAWEAFKKKQMLPKLHEMFKELDTDDSGGLEFDEIKNAPAGLQDQLSRVCNMEDLEEIFRMLDIDDSGTLDLEEFCNGVLRIQSDHKPPELLRLMKQGTEILKRLKTIADRLEAPAAIEEPRVMVVSTAEAAAAAPIA